MALPRLARALPAAVLVALAVATAAPSLADAKTVCRRDSGGNLVCAKADHAKAERCTLTCRKDSGGHTVCRERCR